MINWYVSNVCIGSSAKSDGEALRVTWQNNAQSLGESGHGYDANALLAESYCDEFGVGAGIGGDGPVALDLASDKIAIFVIN